MGGGMGGGMGEGTGRGNERMGEKMRERMGARAGLVDGAAVHARMRGEEELGLAVRYPHDIKHSRCPQHPPLQPPPRLV